MDDITELVERLRNNCFSDLMDHAAADAIERLVAERDEAKQQLKYFGELASEEHDRQVARAEVAEAESFGFEGLYREALARAEKLEAALEQIERYASDDHVKRRARAALKEQG